MTKRELLAAVASKVGITVSLATEVYDATFEVLAKEIKKGGVRVDGFGSFKLVKRAARVAKNPRTGAKIKVPAKKAVTFKAASDLKAKVNK